MKTHVDPLEVILDALLDGAPAEALRRLHALDLNRLSRVNRGRALALEIVCVAATDEDAADRLLELSLKDNAAELLSTALELTDLGELDRAEKVLLCVCEAAPDSPEPAHALGLVLSQQERWEDALVPLRKSFGNTPPFVPSGLSLGQALEALERFPEAAEAFRAYLTLEPADVDGWIRLATTESERGKYDEAKAAYDRAEKIDPGNVSLQFNRAVTATRVGDRVSIARAASRLAKIAPHDWQTASVDSMAAEADGKIERGWECSVRAYALARESDDADDVEAAALAALFYANTHGLQSRTGALVEMIFEDEPFSVEVLLEIRMLAGKEPAVCEDYLVRIEGRIVDPDAVTWFSGGGGAQAFRYFRSYRVYAKTAEEAGGAAIEFESRSGFGADLRVESSKKQDEEPDEIEPHSPGVWDRDPQARIFPTKAETGR